MSFENRFWPKVDKRGPDECWPWIGAHDSRGYGHFWIGGRKRKATQVSWEIANGTPFPEGKMACHTCDNPPCVNPRHLWPGTMSDNIKDARAKGRVKIPHEIGYKGSWQTKKTHCPRGHELSGDNLQIVNGGRSRTCRICNNASKMKSQKKRRSTLKAQCRKCGDSGFIDLVSGGDPCPDCTEAQ